MEVGGISNIGPTQKIFNTAKATEPPKKGKVTDLLDVSDFLSIKKAIGSAIPVNEIKFKQLQQLLSTGKKIEISDEQLQTAINNFLNEIFS